MSLRLAERWKLFREAIKRPWAKVLLVFFSLVGFYDTVIAQFLPKAAAQSAPNMYEMIYETAIWLAAWPWWIWVFGLFLTALLSTIELAVRQSRRLQILEAAQKQQSTRTSLSSTYTVAELSTFSGLHAPEDMGVLAQNTHVSLLLDGSLFSFQGSNNISSISDNGSGDLTINFIENLRSDYFVRITSDGSVTWKILERQPSSCRIKFFGEEPSRVRLDFVS